MLEGSPTAYIEPDSPATSTDPLHTAGAQPERSSSIEACGPQTREPAVSTPQSCTEPSEEAIASAPASPAVPLGSSTALAVQPSPATRCVSRTSPVEASSR